MSKTLGVWLDQSLAGLLQQDLSGRMSFSYDSSAQRPLSISMPLRTEPYGDRVCESFFGGLLPESEQARQLIGKTFGVNGNNSFSLLSVIGHDCAGAITILPEGDIPSAPKDEPLSFLNETELARHIRELPRRPLLAGVEGIRLSLAGASDKTAVCVVENNIALPPDGKPTSHILKPAINTVGNTAANEFFCMTLARKAGVPAAIVKLQQAEEIHYLLVERYDRITTGSGEAKRIHQEDFCQALGIVAANKYTTYWRHEYTLN
jgi:serine/threonine-protein kinase HipA